MKLEIWSDIIILDTKKRATIRFKIENLIIIINKNLHKIKSDLYFSFFFRFLFFLVICGEKWKSWKKKLFVLRITTITMNNNMKKKELKTKFQNSRIWISKSLSLCYFYFILFYYLSTEKNIEVEIKSWFSFHFQVLKPSIISFLQLLIYYSSFSFIVIIIFVLSSLNFI